MAFHTKVSWKCIKYLNGDLTCLHQNPKTIRMHLPNGVLSHNYEKIGELFTPYFLQVPQILVTKEDKHT